MRLRTIGGLMALGLCAGWLAALSVRVRPTQSSRAGVETPVKPTPILPGPLSAKIAAGSPPAAARVLDTYASSPLSFEAWPEPRRGRGKLRGRANQGQADAQVKFLSRGRGYSVLLRAREAVLAFGPPGAGGTLRMKLVGANPAARLVGREPLPGRVHYYWGNDPKKWRTDVRSYAKVHAQGVYPGVDVVYYGSTALPTGGPQRQLEYDFVVAPGADPNAIRLRFADADKLDVDAQGNLILRIAGGEVVQQAPRIYQEIDGTRRPIAGGYVLLEPLAPKPIRHEVGGYVLLAPENREPTNHGPGVTGHESQITSHDVGFQVAAYDRSRPLIIDPVLSYSTYLGGSNADQSFKIAVDAEGNMYIVGNVTRSRDFPTENPFQPEHGGGPNFYDTFVTKFDPSGSTLIYSTYLGGSGDDLGFGLAVDAEGNAYVTGSTGSPNFPTAKPFQGVLRGTSDAFVTKLDAEGGLVYSTYLGGSLSEAAHGVAVDAEGNAYVAGGTNSPDFPTAKPFQANLRGPGDVFVTKFDPSGSALIYSTYLGGSNAEAAWGIAVDAGGQAYVTGSTTSLDFPTESPVQPAYGGDEDAFVTKFDASGTALVYSTYLGGSDYERGHGVAVDGEGNAYITGYTASLDFPTANPFQPERRNLSAFVTKLDASGTALVYSTYLGGWGGEIGYDIAVGAAGNAYVAGSTLSVDFPTTKDAIQPEFGGATDAFITQFDASGTALVFSTYLGGRGTDVAFGIAVDTQGNIYVTGWTGSTDFPIRNPFQEALVDINGDAIVAKISPGESRSAIPKR